MMVWFVIWNALMDIMDVRIEEDGRIANLKKRLFV